MSFLFRRFVAAAGLLGLPLVAAAQSAPPVVDAKPTPVKPVRAGLTDSVYARHYRQQRHLLDAITRNQPLSWIAAGGEFARRHQTAANAPETKPDYVFSAYLNTMFVVVSQPRFAFTVEPAFGLRMRREGGGKGSFPIRTPSYHAVGALYISTRMKITPAPPDTAATRANCPPPLEVDQLRYQFLRLNFRHHSNGQEGAAFMAGPNGRQPNQLNGNFANNAVEAAYVIGARTQGGAWSVAPYGSYGLPSSADPTQQGRYLFHRVGIRLTREEFSTWRRVLGKSAQVADVTNATNAQLARRNKSRFYTEVNVSLGLSRLDSLTIQERRFERRRLNAEATAVYIPRFMSQTGLFVTVGYYGEDPYNIWYLHRYPFVRAGIATAGFRNVTQLFR